MAEVNKKLNLHAQSVDFDYKSADVDLGSGISDKILEFLVDLVLKAVGSSVKSSISSQVQDALNKEFGKIGDLIPSQIPLGSEFFDLTLDISMNWQPKSSQNHLELGFNCDIFFPGEQPQILTSESEMKFDDQTRFSQVITDKVCPQNILKKLFQHEKFDYVVNGTIVEQFMATLDTKVVNGLFPALKTQPVQNVAFEFKVNQTSYPLIKIIDEEDERSFGFYLNYSMTLILGNKGNETRFVSGNLMSSVDARTILLSNSVVFSLTDIDFDNFQFTAQDISSGKVDPNEVKATLKSLKLPAISMLNQVVYTHPMKWLSFSSIEASLKRVDRFEDYLRVLLDFSQTGKSFIMDLVRLKYGEKLRLFDIMREFNTQ